MVFAPYPNGLYTTFSFFGFIMCLIPLPWHLRAWNVGTCLYMFWAGIGCLIFFVNSIVWNGNAFNPAPIWCDICAKFIIGGSIGIPASSLCINRRLYLLQSNPAGNAATTKSAKIRVVAIDLGISLGSPILFMILHYIPQGHRSSIFEDVGCYPYTYGTWVAVVVLNVPPVLIGLISSTYGFCTIISINKRRKSFNELLARQLNVTASLYIRLMWLAGIEVFLTVPIALFFLVYNVTVLHLYPWISWEDTHAHFNREEFARWIYVVCAILFFSFFGFAEEARRNYRLGFRFFLKTIGIRVGRQTEIPIAFHTGPISQVGLNGRLTLAGKGRRRAASIPTISTFYPESAFSEKEGSSSDTTLQGTQDTVRVHLGLGSNTSLDPSTARHTRPPTIPASQLAPIIEKTAKRIPPIPSDAHSPAAVDPGNQRRPSASRRFTQNLRSFLNLDYNDLSIKHVSATYPSQLDNSTIEEARPPEAKPRSGHRLSRHFRSFLNFS